MSVYSFKLKTMEELDRFLTKFCLGRMKRLGIVPENKVTLQAGVMFTGYFSAILILPYLAWCGIVRPILLAQYICLTVFLGGLFVPLIYYRKTIISICHECETIPDIDMPWMQKEYKTLQKKSINSFERKYSTTSNNIVFLNGFLMVTTPFVLNYIKGNPVELPFSGSVENVYFYTVLYVLQTLYLLVAVISCGVLVDVFTMTIMHMKVQYQLIEQVLIRLKTAEDQERVLKQCIIHHMNLIKIFKKIQKIFKTVLFWIYIGLFSSSATTRAVIMSDMDFLLVPALFGEIIYLSPYCFSMSALIDANHMTRFALYRTEWYTHPIKMRKSINIMMLRMIRDPSISIYTNGPALTNRSYISFINATFTYIASGILMG